MTSSGSPVRGPGKKPVKARESTPSAAPSPTPRSTQAQPAGQFVQRGQTFNALSGASKVQADGSGVLGGNPLLAKWTGPHGGVPALDKVKTSALGGDQSDQRDGRGEAQLGQRGDLTLHQGNRADGLLALNELRRRPLGVPRHPRRPGDRRRPAPHLHR